MREPHEGEGGDFFFCMCLDIANLYPQNRGWDSAKYVATTAATTGGGVTRPIPETHLLHTGHKVYVARAATRVQLSLLPPLLFRSLPPCSFLFFFSLPFYPGWAMHTKAKPRFCTMVTLFLRGANKANRHSNQIPSVVRPRKIQESFLTNISHPVPSPLSFSTHPSCNL